MPGVAMTCLKSLLACGLALASVAGEARAATVTFSVTSTADSGPGSLRQAILALNAEIDPATEGFIEFRTAFPLNGRIELASPLPGLTRSTFVRGMSRGAVIDAGGAFPVFTAAEPIRELNLLEIELANGRAQQQGGCIDGTGVGSVARLYAVDVVFRNCQVESVQESKGGAIYWPGRRLELRYNRFIGNRVHAKGVNGVARGGAVAAEPGTWVFAEGVRFESNAAEGADSEGGDISLSGRGQLREVISTGARAGSRGGSVAHRCGASPCELLIESSHIGSAQAAVGGAIWGLGVQGNPLVLQVDNSVFVDNQAGSGGALALGGTRIDARHLSLLRNQAPVGAHLHSEDSEATAFANSVLDAPSSGSACSGLLSGAAGPNGTLVESADCVALLGGGTRVESLKYLRMFATGRWAPVPLFQADSPIIDAGLRSLCTHGDAHGRVRPVDGDGNGTAECDAGAYEHSNRVSLFANGFEL